VVVVALSLHIWLSELKTDSTAQNNMQISYPDTKLHGFLLRFSQYDKI